jgi:hypothetical protein
MKLTIKRVPLQCEVIESHRQSIKKNNHDAFNRMVCNLGMAPDNETVKIMYEAMMKGTKVLKTRDVTLLNLTSIIKKFGITVEKL